MLTKTPAQLSHWSKVKTYLFFEKKEPLKNIGFSVIHFSETLGGNRIYMHDSDLYIALLSTLIVDFVGLWSRALEV